MDGFTWYLPDGLSDGDALCVRRLAFQQHAVAQRSQLYDAGLTPRQIEHACTSGRWQNIAGVIVLHNAELSPVQQLEVATRVGVDVVALAARTSAGTDGLANWPAPALEVLVRKGATYPALPFPVRVHESRRFTREDIVDRSPARVTVERAIVDAAAWAEAAAVSAGLLAAAVQQRLTTPERLQAQLEASGQIRRVRLLRHVVADIAGGAEALSEMAFLRYCRRWGLPRPKLQQVRRDAAGKRRYIDATFRKRSGKLLRVEIDGAIHLLAHSYWADQIRGNELVLADEQVLRFPSWRIHANDPLIAHHLARALDLSVLDAPLPA